MDKLQKPSLPKPITARATARVRGHVTGSSSDWSVFGRGVDNDEALLTISRGQFNNRPQDKNRLRVFSSSAFQRDSAFSGHSGGLWEGCGVQKVLPFPPQVHGATDAFSLLSRGIRTVEHE